MSGPNNIHCVNLYSTGAPFVLIKTCSVELSFCIFTRSLWESSQEMGHLALIRFFSGGSDYRWGEGFRVCQGSSSLWFLLRMTNRHSLAFVSFYQLCGPMHGLRSSACKPSTACLQVDQDWPHNVHEVPSFSVEALKCVWYFALTRISAYLWVLRWPVHQTITFHSFSISVNPIRPHLEGCPAPPFYPQTWP